MKKHMNYRVRCPCCGMLSWTSRLFEKHPIEFYIQHGKGGGLALEPILPDNEFINEVRPYFLEMCLQLIVQGFLPQELIAQLHAGGEYSPVLKQTPQTSFRYQPKTTIVE